MLFSWRKLLKVLLALHISTIKKNTGRNVRVSTQNSLVATKSQNKGMANTAKYDEEAGNLVRKKVWHLAAIIIQKH